MITATAPSMTLSTVERLHIQFARTAAVVFILNTAFPVAMKLAEHRLSSDWLHSVLHLASALLAIFAGWRASSIRPARFFTWGVGICYLGLGIYGLFQPGLFLHTPLAIPLGLADNVFHLSLALPALLVAGLDMHASVPPLRHASRIDRTNR